MSDWCRWAETPTDPVAVGTDHHGGIWFHEPCSMTPFETDVATVLAALRDGEVVTYGEVAAEASTWWASARSQSRDARLTAGPT